MTKASKLSELGIRQQRALFECAANETLPGWQLGEYSLDWISYSTNAVFDVGSQAGRYVLRLHPPGRITEDSLQAELLWLRAIRQRTKLLAPVPAPHPDGRLFISITSPMLNSADKLHCVLFERLEGEIKPAGALTLEDMRLAGAYLGGLHRDAQCHLPADLVRHRLDYEGMFGAESPYYVAKDSDMVAREHRDVFREVRERVRHAMTRLDRRGAGFGLVHADLLAKNILFADRAMAALDFEFCGWGYFLYDLAPLLWQLKGERAAAYAPLEESLWGGYLSVRREAENERDQLDTLIAARQLLSCRWLLQNLHQPSVRKAAPALIAARSDELKNFLATGVLQRRTATL